MIGFLKKTLRALLRIMPNALKNFLNKVCVFILNNPNPCNTNSSHSGYENLLITENNCRALACPFGYVTHASAFGPGNAGDSILSIATEDVINKYLSPQIYYNQRVWEKPNLERINASKAFFFGGGGLLWKKPYSEKTSGWQWNCSIEDLDKISVPMFGFGVGWILRSGDTFSPLFYEHITRMFQKDNFHWLGLRNQYSIDKVLEFLPKELHSKISYQPCATLLGSSNYPQYQQSLNEFPSENIEVAFSVGMDQLVGIAGNPVYAPFLNNEQLEVFRSALKAFIMFLANQGVKVYIAGHCRHDHDLFSLLDIKDHPNIFYKSLLDFPPTAVYSFYQKMTAVFGMRLHGILIPAGLQVPVFVIAAHDERAAIPMEWQKEYMGIDIRSPDLYQLFLDKWEYLRYNYWGIKNDLQDLQDIHNKITADNLNRFVKPFFISSLNC